MVTYLWMGTHPLTPTILGCETSQPRLLPPLLTLLPLAKNSLYCHQRRYMSSLLLLVQRLLVPLRKCLQYQSLTTCPHLNPHSRTILLKAGYPRWTMTIGFAFRLRMRWHLRRTLQETLLPRFMYNLCPNPLTNHQH